MKIPYDHLMKIETQYKVAKISIAVLCFFVFLDIVITRDYRHTIKSHQEIINRQHIYINSVDSLQYVNARLAYQFGYADGIISKGWEEYRKDSLVFDVNLRRIGK